MSYTVIITEEIAANVAVTTQNYPITIEYNATNIASGTTYGNANVSNYLASGTNTANIVTTGNVQGAYVIGNGSALTNLTGANVTGTVANATYAASAGLASYVTANAQANITSVGTLTSLSVTGNVTGGNIVSAGQGNIDNILTDSVTFDTAAAESTAVAKLSWSSAYGTMSHGLGDGSLLLDGMDLVIYATNGEANTLSKGEVVYISGASGDRAEVRRAAATSDTLSATTIGIVKSNIASGAAGYITTQGVVDGLNLGAYTPGQVVWLSSTPGQFTATQPVAPTHTVFIGVVERANAGNGRLLVRVNNGWELGELHDVKITTPADDQYLKYSVSAGNIWVNAGLDISDDTTPALGGDLAAGAYNISGTGNVVAGNVIGNGQYLTNLTAGNIVGTVANATYATSAGSATTATTAGTANIALVAYSVNAANVSGTVANATYADTAGSATTATTATSATTAGTVTTNAQPNITSVGTLAGLTATGNVNLGNVVVNADNIRNVNAINLNATPSPQRITLGTGYNGNFGANVDPFVISRGGTLTIADKYNIGNADSNMAQRMVNSTLYADMGGQTLTANGRRLQPLQGTLFLGNGTQQVTGGPVFATATGLGGTVGIGNIQIGTSTVDMGGTTTVSHTAAAQFGVSVGGNASVGNAVGVNSLIQTITNTTGNTTTGIGFISQFAGNFTSTTAPTNVYGYYMAGTTATHGINNTNNWRRATNYYFLMNEDDVAQNRLGSLRRYHEFNGVSGTTSGSLTIDKNNGQVQQVNLAGNISSVAFSNFVSSASDSVNTDEQCDTVTIAFNQGATGGYSVTFPTGSEYKYAGNVRTLQSTAANSVSLVSVSALRLSGTTTYLITISPGFVS